MTQMRDGLATYHTRVESWECDFNGHWNTKFYTRSFEAASEVLAAKARQDAPDIPVRQVRFHRELLNGDAVEIRSFAAVDAEGAPAVAHFMLRGDEVVATCLDLADPLPGFLPLAPGSETQLALPRGVVGPRRTPWKADPATDSIVEVGPTRPGDYDPRGNIGLETLMRFCAVTTHAHAAALGYTLEFTKQTGISRMLVELRLTRFSSCPVGTCLTAASRLIAAGGKSFNTANYLYTQTGEPIVMFELSILAVDMKTRRATAIPDIIGEAQLA
jgi:acyl-CoA thioesterase FadM